MVVVLYWNYPNKMLLTHNEYVNQFIIKYLLKDKGLRCVETLISWMLRERLGLIPPRSHRC